MTQSWERKQVRLSESDSKRDMAPWGSQRIALDRAAVSKVQPSVGESGHVTAEASKSVASKL